MKIRKLTPLKVVLGLRQIVFTFTQTAKLIWSTNRTLLILAFAINILSGVLIFPTLYLEKLTIDALVGSIGNPFWQEALRGLGLLFFLRITIGILQSAISRTSGFLQYSVARSFSGHVDILLGQKMSQLDMETVEDPDFKDRFNKVERESGQRVWGLAMPLLQIPNFFFSLFSTFGLLFFFNPLIALLVFILAIPEFFLDARFTKLEYQLQSSKSAKYRMWGWLTYYLTKAKSLLEVRILAISPHFLKRIKEIQDDIIGQTLTLRRQRETAHFLTFLPQNILSFGFSLYLGFLVIVEKVSVGSAEMYLRAVSSFQGSLTGLVGAFLDLYENYLFVTDLIWFLDLKPTISSGKKRFPKKIKNGIEFKDVWFKYKEDKPWILKGVNLFIKKGESLAIVGENGAGKTTFIKLLCRFYDPQKGEILIDGVNLKDYDREDYWKNLAVLFQNFEGFPFTARESIGYGRISEVDNLTLVQQSAKKSVIDDYISSLPLKYENPLAAEFEKGTEPSIGQWQRIGLARVLMRGAQIVILDEPTSNVDPKSEEEIFGKISTLAKGQNLILISHRFSTVRRAEKICVMDKGKITEIGTHEELMKLKGTYHQLFNLQAKSYQ